MNDWRDPIHPGEILGEELAAIDLRPMELAARIGVPNNRIYQIVEGKRSITADTALRLGVFFSVSPQFWLNLQQGYELDLARRRIGDSLAAIRPYRLTVDVDEQVERLSSPPV